MANQLQVTVVRSNGSTYTQSFSVNDIWVQENTGSATVNAIIWVSNEISYKVSETISALATLAGSSMIQATVKQLPSGERENFQALFPSAACAIGQSTGTSGINSFIVFKTQSYYCSETQSALVTAANAGGGGGSYLVYTAILSQTGTDAPVPTVLGDNTIGAIVWSRIGIGDYRGTLAGAFPDGKTFFPNPTPDIWNANPFWLFIGRVDDDNIVIQSVSNSLAVIDMGAPNYVEIRVYP